MDQRKLLALIEEVISKSTDLDLTSILPKVLSIAKQLGDTKFEQWLLLEMLGYVNTNKAMANETKVPDYRKVPGQFRDRNNRLLQIDDPSLFQIINNHHLREGVVELEPLSKNQTFLAFDAPAAAKIVKEHFGVEVKSFEFNPLSINAILSEIRTQIIEWLFVKQKEIKASLSESNIDVNTPIELSGLHPLVQRTAGDYYKNGHYSAAILFTYIALVNVVKAKSGREDLDNTPLMQSVFSPNNPILRISDQSDEQLGFMWLYSGAVMAIRNPKAHKIIEQNDPQRTLEWLSFASVLLRVLDDTTSK